MNAHGIKKIFGRVLFAVAICLFCAGCRTTNSLQTDVADAVQRNSYLTGRIEQAVNDIDAVQSNFVERCEVVVASSRRIEETSKRLYYLFSEYEQIVADLLDNFDRIRNELKTSAQGDNKINNSVDSGRIGSFDTAVLNYETFHQVPLGGD